MCIDSKRFSLMKYKKKQKYEWTKQSVCTCDNKKLSLHISYWSQTWAVAFAVSAKEFGIFLNAKNKSYKNQMKCKLQCKN
jgi:hypothetical protein